MTTIGLGGPLPGDVAELIPDAEGDQDDRADQDDEE